MTSPDTIVLRRLATTIRAVFTALALLATTAQGNLRSVDVNVDPGTSRDNNVGAGFSLVTKEATKLDIHLYSSKGTIVESAVEWSAAGIVWEKKSETHFQAVGVCPNTPFWCRIRSTLVYEGKGEGVVERWMSVSYVDLDADTDNNSTAPHRPPSRSQDEDHWEYPGVKGSDVVGLVIPINDNNDNSWPQRDSWTPLNPADPEALRLKLDVRPRKAGKWSLVSNYPNVVWWDSNTTVNQADSTLGRNQDIDDRTLCLVTGHDMVSGTRGFLWAMFTPDEPRTGFSVEDMTNVLSLGCDIDVDTSNTGVIDNYNDGTSGSDFYEAHPVHLCPPVFRYGMIVGVNDDGNNHPDNGWDGTSWWDNSDDHNWWNNPDGNSIQGNEDRKDLRPGILRGLRVSEPLRALIDQQHLAPGVRLTKVSGPGAIRIFTESGQYNAVLIADGQSVGGTSLWNAVYQNDMAILVEGLRAGEVMLAYELYLRNGAVSVHRDIVRITVAPWMATSHRDEAVRVYVTSATPDGNRSHPGDRSSEN